MVTSSTIEAAAARLRADALAVPAGTMLGGEEAVQRRLAVSRPTARQAARIVEREGLLKVRRGHKGGYFAARPEPGFIEATVASYLQALDAQPEDLTRVATALWVETVTDAARRGRDAAAPVVARLRAAVRTLKPEAGFAAIMAVERAVRRDIFDLSGGRYVELIFDINEHVARRDQIEPLSIRDGTPDHAAFVVGWRKAVLMQLDAIGDADAEIAAIAAKRCRQLFHHRVWGAPGTAARTDRAGRSRARHHVAEDAGGRD